MLLAGTATFPNSEAAGLGVLVLPKIEVAGCNVVTVFPDVLPKSEVVDWLVGAAAPPKSEAVDWLVGAAVEPLEI